MATHRVIHRNLLHANPVLWLGEIKRQDSRITSRLLLLKEIKGPQSNTPRHTIKLQTETCLGNRWLSPIVPTSSNGLNSAINPAENLYSAAAPKPAVSPPSSDMDDKPSADQLQYVYDSIQTNLPRLFTHTMDYKIYSQDVVLINNIHNKTTHGLFKYVQQVALLRFGGHFKFAYVRAHLVSMSQHPMEGRITVKWQVVGISGLRVFLKFWKFKLWRWEEIMKHQEVWFDAISHFDVGSDGLVYRHILDKVEEDKEQLDLKKTAKSPLVAKLALIAALFPRNIVAYQSLQSQTSTTPNNSQHNRCIEGQKSSNSTASVDCLS